MTQTSTGQVRTLCTAVCKNGEPCRAYAVTGYRFCLSHDPERAAQMAAARRAGGRARHGRHIGATGASEPVSLQGPGDVLRVLQDELNEVRSMERSIARSRAVASLLSVYMQTWESSEIERRLSALEAAAARQREELRT